MASTIKPIALDTNDLDAETLKHPTSGGTMCLAVIHGAGDHTAWAITIIEYGHEEGGISRITSTVVTFETGGGEDDDDISAEFSTAAPFVAARVTTAEGTASAVTLEFWDN